MLIISYVQAAERQQKETRSHHHPSSINLVRSLTVIASDR